MASYKAFLLFGKQIVLIPFAIRFLIDSIVLFVFESLVHIDCMVLPVGVLKAS